MNGKYKEFLNKSAQDTAVFLRNLSQTLISLLRMCVLSSIRVVRRSKKYPLLRKSKSCCVLGNGPSLKDDFDNG